MALTSTSTVIRAGLCLIVMTLAGVEAKTQTRQMPDFSEMLKVSRVSAPLATDERALAVRLAEQKLKSNKLLPEKKTVLTLVQTHRNIEAERKGIFERHALLTYYKYAGDLGILVYVNLDQRRVIRLEQLPHFPAPLGAEEIQRARELALNNPQLKKVLEPYRNRLTVEALLTSNPVSEDPLSRHRLLYLLFKVGPRYLTAQGEVFVDLTAETVTIQLVSQREGDNRKH